MAELIVLFLIPWFSLNFIITYWLGKRGEFRYRHDLHGYDRESKRNWIYVCLLFGVLLSIVFLSDYIEDKIRWMKLNYELPPSPLETVFNLKPRDDKTADNSKVRMY